MGDPLPQRGRGLFDDVTHITGLAPALTTRSNGETAWSISIVMATATCSSRAGISRTTLTFGTTPPVTRPAIFCWRTRAAEIHRCLRSLGGRIGRETQRRGAAFDDLDNDGDIDVVILNSRREPTLLRNDSPRTNHWIQIRLRGTRSNRDGIGARIKVVAGDLNLIDEVHSGRGYQSHYGMYLHFGLGHRTRIDRIEVRWIGGGTNVLEGVEVDRLLQITEEQPR